MPSVEEEIEGMADAITVMVSTRELPGEDGTALVIRLVEALEMVGARDSAAATTRLISFSKNVVRLLDLGRIAPSDGWGLIVAAEVVRAHLED